MGAKESGWLWSLVRGIRGWGWRRRRAACYPTPTRNVAAQPAAQRGEWCVLWPGQRPT